MKPDFKEGVPHDSTAAEPRPVARMTRGGRTFSVENVRPLRLTLTEQSEYNHQRSVVSCMIRFGHPECLWYAIPNQQSSGPERGHFFKLLGVRPGAPDLVFLFRGKTLHLELKRYTGKQSPTQHAFECLSKAAGAEYLVSRDLKNSLKLLFERGILTRDLS